MPRVACLFIKDRTDYICKLEKSNINWGNSILATMEVTSLYTNIPTDDGITTVRQILLETMDFTVAEQNYIIQLMDLVLKNYTFLFESRFLLQIMGTAIGCNVATTFTIIYMNEFERRFVYTHPYFNNVAMWVRFIDDIFVVWQGGVESLLGFHKDINCALPSISLSLDHSREQISFLDILFQGKQPAPNLKESLPLSQLMRVKHIVSNPDLQTTRLREMTDKFCIHGYADSTLNKPQHKVESMSRQSLLTPNPTKKDIKQDRITCVTTYSK